MSAGYIHIQSVFQLVSCYLQDYCYLAFTKKETNICKMTKKGQKMSFHARKVEIMANIGIMEIVIERHREAETLIFTGDEVIWGY